MTQIKDTGLYILQLQDTPEKRPPTIIIVIKSIQLGHVLFMHISNVCRFSCSCNNAINKLNVLFSFSVLILAHGAGENL